MKSLLVLFALVALVGAQSDRRPRPPNHDSHDSRDSRDSRDSHEPRPRRTTTRPPRHRDSSDSRDSHERPRPGGFPAPGNPQSRSGGPDTRDSNEFSRQIQSTNNVPITRAFSFNGRNTLGCGFACSTSATFTTNIDGTSTTARCSDPSADASTRCPGCCQSVALAANVQGDRAAGFPSNNGRTCVCCIRSC